MTRWGAPKPVEPLRISAISAIQPLINPLANEFKYPTQEELKMSERAGVTNKLVTQGEIEKINNDGKTWINSLDTELIERLLVIAHFGISAHSSKAAMTKELAKRFHIKDLSKKVVNFVNRCLPCHEVTIQD